MVEGKYETYLLNVWVWVILLNLGLPKINQICVINLSLIEEAIKEHIIELVKNIPLKITKLQYYINYTFKETTEQEKRNNRISELHL